MADPADRPRLARLFFALDLDDSARASLATWRDAALAREDGLRLIPASALHLTLAFLGRRPETEIAEVARIGLSAASGRAAPLLSPRAVVGVPRRGPRLLALDLEDPEGAAGYLAAAVSGELAAAGLHEPERRPFWPHLTLARVRGTRGRGTAFGPPAGPLEAPVGALGFDRLTLYRSHLSPRGARYEAIDGRPLDGLR